MNHFTNRTGYDAIRSQVVWLFEASTPVGGNPCGAYFTTLDPQERKLASRLRVPRDKVGYYFSFTGDEGLIPLRGGRGAYVFYSPGDYRVERPRQTAHGPTKIL